MDPTEEAMKVEKKETKAKLDWKVIGSFRFILACYVMFMHIGSNKSWGAFNNLRGWPWHVHVFFTLGGYSMASPMNPTIQKKFSYFLARIWSMYPMYAVALIFGLINLLIVCRPSTFRSVRIFISISETTLVLIKLLSSSFLPITGVSLGCTARRFVSRRWFVGSSLLRRNSSHAY